MKFPVKRKPVGFGCQSCWKSTVVFVSSIATQFPRGIRNLISEMKEAQRLKRKYFPIAEKL